MWSKSDKYAVFMLLWMIVGAVVSSKVFAIVCTIFAMIYGVMSLWTSFKEEVIEHPTD